MRKLIRKPTAEELSILNQHFAPETVKEDDVYILDVEAARSATLTSYFSFLGEDMIQGFHDDVVRRHTDESAEKIGFMFGHDHGSIPSGVLFNSQVLTDNLVDTDGNPVTVKRFRPTVSMRKNLNVAGVNTDDYVKAVNAGQTEAVSVGWNANSFICGICGNDVRSWDCIHVPGRYYNTAPEGETPIMKLATYTVHQGAVKKHNLLELSAVYAPGLPGARIKSKLAADGATLSLKDGKVVDKQGNCLMSTNIKDFKPTDILRFNLSFDGDIEKVGEVEGDNMTLEELQNAYNALQAEKNTLQATLDGVNVALESEKARVLAVTAERDEVQTREKAAVKIFAQSEVDKVDLTNKLAASGAKVTELQAEVATKETVVKEYRTHLEERCSKLSIAVNGASHNPDIFTKEIAALSNADLKVKIEGMEKQLAQLIPTGRKTVVKDGVVTELNDNEEDRIEDKMPVNYDLHKIGK